MTDRVGYILSGIVLAAIGGFSVVGGQDTDSRGLLIFGAVVLAVGAILMQIGVIAVGVALGVRDRRI